MSRLRVFMAVAALSLLVASAATAQWTLTPEQDVYVNSENPSTNYAGTADLFLGKGTFWGLGFWRTYTIFDVSPLAGQLIDSAEFSIWQFDTGAAAGGLPCDAHRVTAAWDESTITWNSKPAHDSTVLSSADVGDSFYTGWITWDITALVRDWIDSAVENQGVVLKHYFEQSAGASRYGIFHATESSQTDLRPRLVVRPATTAVEPSSRGAEPSSWGAIKNVF
jgi:hypothetical protein